MVAFGALDLFAFYRSFPKLIRMIENYTPNLYQVLLFLMILSLLASGPLYMVGNRLGYVVYYFQFPLRLTFLTALTFGFVFKLVTTQPGTLGNGMVMASIFALEAVRLMLTIQKNKASIS
jgi:hypothetical protein